MSALEPAHTGLHNPPPDPKPRVPTFSPPEGSWDCHIHLFGPVRDFPFDPASPYVSDDALPEDYLRTAKVLGLKRAVIVSGGGYGANYRHLQSVLERFAESFRGVILPRPDIRADEVAALNTLGVRGVRMFGGTGEWSHLPRLDLRIAHLIHEAGWHVQYHSLQRGEITESAQRLLELPNPIVLDHFGMFDPRLGIDQPAFRTILDLLSTGRVWVKLSGPMRCSPEEFPYAGMTPFARALVRHAPERLVWASDWPHVQMNGRVMPNDGALFDLLAEWAPDQATRFRILSQNPLELYD